ncbi:MULTISPECIES: enhanced intracellular survival protein Eis [unclassified Rhodococcus (in: high G+C Gram-positive bacteria)]|uniref:enhanced intracellular survival protein Eis n=1 Tax=unclassified Rhodococcus (in: high G+C Gram-positive bacteria) TaxID=192944 RepID=UPI0005D3D252|nr:MULTISPECIES: enhanced intracellular survival protein Eis [unclassified Rhodococcus (in: high G+C Gram-positive bacteria)]KJF24064.1 Enhanced intracellular survival protein [Rhodococcus sp. AD45]
MSVSTDNQITIRTATEADWPAIQLLDSTGFGFHPSSADKTLTRTLYRPEDIVVATEGDQVVGLAIEFDMEITVPGGNQLPTRGITWVSVAPTHRRRGILRSMFVRLHHHIASTGAPLVALTASDARIYNRFGYGPATVSESITIDRRFADFRPQAPTGSGVRITDAQTAATLLPAIYDRWRLVTPGAQRRPQAHWDFTFADPSDHRAGASGLFFLTHPDGYVSYRHRSDGSDSVVDIAEFVAINDDAYAALWRTMCGLDLVTRIEAEQHPEDPLRLMLTDYRSVRTTRRSDRLWLRIMNVPAALEAREYAADLDTVIKIEDPFLDSGGTFALSIRGGKATCRPTDADAQITMPSDILSSIYLGSHQARIFAAAGRVQASTPQEIRDFDFAFGTTRPAVMGYGF